jgi:hypothetical protein
MEFEGFISEPFPTFEVNAVGEVYVLFYSINGIEIPFYIGQTRRFTERMGDYAYGQFEAPTDFKVASAMKFFCEERGCSIRVGHKPSENRFAEERSLLKKAKELKLILLNDCPGYDCKKITREQAELAVLDFCRKNYAIQHSA